MLISTSAAAALVLPFASAHAATVTLSATAIGNYDQWSASDPVPKYTLVAANNGDGGYINTDNSNERQTFVFNGLSLPAGSVINSIALSAVARRTGGSPSMALLAEQGAGSGNRSAGSSISPANSYTTYTRTMNTNPFTSAAWTQTSINNTVRFGVQYNSGGPNDIRVTQMYLVVTYTAPVCGDSAITGAETCDDGNTTNGDGCSASCAIESGFQCSGAPSVCSPIQVCGNGAITGTETCDDGNTTNGDGCSSACSTEEGFTCDGTPSICSPTQVCGNGAITGTETCDDGNTTNGDGCSSSCSVEEGYMCSSAPSICSFIPVCGDAILTMPTETCDDGNTTNGDGCDSSCQIEVSGCFQQVCTPGAPICVPGPMVCTPGPQSCVPGPLVCTGEGEEQVCVPGADVCTPGADICIPGEPICTPGPDICVTVPVSCEPEPTSSSSSSTGGGEVRAGGHRGDRTNEAFGLASFLASRSNFASTLPPGAFGGTKTTPLSYDEISYICSVRRAGLITDDGYIEVLSKFMAQFMFREPTTIAEALMDPTLCKEIDASLKPKLVAAAAPKFFYVDSLGFATSSNGFWNECFRNGGSTAFTYQEYMKDVEQNPETDKYGLPYACGKYYSTNGDLELWHLPFGGMSFSFNRQTKEYTLPKGYTVARQTEVVQK